MLDLNRAEKQPRPELHVIEGLPDPESLILGYTQLESLEGGDIVLVVPDTDSAQILQDRGLPAIAAHGDWTEAHGEHLQGLQPVCLFSDMAFRDAVSRATDAFIGEIWVLDLPDMPDIGAFIRGDGDFEELYGKANDPLETKAYSHRDVAMEKAMGQRPKTLSDLMNTTFPPVKWIIPEILPEGLTLIAGPSKLGKSWLTLSTALAVAYGGNVLNEITVEQGDVLLWALEDSERRIQSRIHTLMPYGADWGAGRLSYATADNLPPALDQGGLERIEAWADSVNNPRLVVIDVLEKVAPEKKASENEYKAIYRGLKDIHQFAARRGLSVLVVHHTVKGGRDGDPFDKVNGTRAFTALPDSTLVLDRDSSGFADATLYGRGRDLMEFEWALDLDNGTWSILGDKETVTRSEERQAVLKALKDAPDAGFSPSDIATLTDMKEVNLRNLLGKMVKSSELKKLGRGRYVLP